MMMPLSHGTDYLFKPGNPGKRLFATHGIVSFIAVFNLTWVIFFMALFVSVISNRLFCSHLTKDDLSFQVEAEVFWLHVGSQCGTYCHKIQ